MLYYFDGATLIPMVYASSEWRLGGISCRQTTDYPREGDIHFNIVSDKATSLKLRVPTWCKSYSLALNGKEIGAEVTDGYISLPLCAGESKVTLHLEREVIVEKHEIEGKPYISVNYGPLLMAHDTHFGGELWQEIGDGAEFTPVVANNEAIVRLDSKEMTLVDFASAGGNSPETDLYTVFIPLK